jgi:tetratricopeptide (TPR) repeat protein
MNCRFLCLIYVFVAPLVSLSSSQATQASEPSGYYLSIDEGTAGSAELMRGDFGAAIAAAHAAARVDQGLSAHLTLCVAYIRTNALENAAAACDKAVRAADVPITTLGNPYGQRNREGLAKAYMNRGVLRTILGELEAAKIDFDYALRQNRQSEMVRHNLQIMNTGMAAAR